MPPSNVMPKLHYVARKFDRYEEVRPGNGVMMMKNQVVLFSVLLLSSACGKSLHLAAKPQGLNGPGVKAELRTLPLGSELTLISEFDRSDASFMMPFLNADEKGMAGRGVGAPAYLGGTDAAPVGYVKSSNIAFRAVFQLPAKDQADLKIKRLALRLKGIHRYIAAGDTSKGLSKQVICIADTRVCSGEKAESTEAEKKNLNPAFWEPSGGKAVVPVNDEFSKIEADEVIMTDSGATVVTTKAVESPKTEQGEEVIELSKLFNIQAKSDAETLAWIYENSSEYAENGYRKMRFVMGDNTSIESGELILEIEGTFTPDFVKTPGKIKNENDEKLITLDPSQRVPSGGVTPGPVVPPAPVDPKNPSGDVDLKLTWSQLPYIKKSGKVGMDADHKAKVKATADVLAEHASDLKAVRVIMTNDKSGSASANLTSSKARATATASILRQNVKIKSLVTGVGYGEVAESTCAPNEDCEADKNTYIHIDFKSTMSKEEKAKLKSDLEEKLHKIWI